MNEKHKFGEGFLSGILAVIPVATFWDQNSRPAIVCTDGSVWNALEIKGKENKGKIDWKETTPIPGTRRAEELRGESSS